MRLLAWMDGAVFEASELRVGIPYVMQRIHTLGGVCYDLEQHINLLRRSSEELFGFASVCGVGDAQRIIVRLLELSRVADSLSVPVAMRLDADARLSFEVEHPTFGSGRYLRAKREVGMPYEMTEPRLLSQTRSSIELDMEADYAVRRWGGERAIWVSREGVLLSRPWMPIFVYYKQCWFTPKRYDTVEYSVVAKAMEQAGCKLLVRDIPESALEQVDEIFVADIMGISSFAKVKNHRLLTSVANRIEQRLEPIK